MLNLARTFCSAFSFIQKTSSAAQQEFVDIVNLCGRQKKALSSLLFCCVLLLFFTSWLALVGGRAVAARLHGWRQRRRPCSNRGLPQRADSVCGGQLQGDRRHAETVVLGPRELLALCWLQQRHFKRKHYAAILLLQRQNLRNIEEGSPIQHAVGLHKFPALQNG